MSNPILIVLVFLSTVLALEGIYMLVVDRRRSGKAQVQRRLQMLSGRIAAGSLAGGETSILRTLESGRRSLADQVLGLLPNRDSLDLLLYRAGMPMSPQRFLTSCAALAGVGWVIASLQLNDMGFGAVGLVLGLVPRVYVGRIARRRTREFEAQFPEALELLTRALRAGHSLSTGFQLVGDEMPEPISLEFAVVAEEIKFGLDVRSALQNLAHRVENRDIPFFITAVLIQRETGGNLAELLDNLGTILRERAQFYGKVHAITSQGRMAANILALWPPITVGLVSMTGSDYLDPLWTTPRGHTAVIASCIGILIGWLLARRLAEVKV